LSLYLYLIPAVLTAAPGSLSSDQLTRQINRFLTYKTPNRGRTQISFYGGNFLGLEETILHNLLETAETFVQAGQVDSIRFSTRPDTINADSLARLKSHSVTSIEVGVQSLDDDVLERAYRGHTAEQSRSALKLLQEAGYETTAQMMTGLPGDTGPQSLTTARELVLLAPGAIRIYPTVVVAGTPLAKQFKEGRYTPQFLKEAVALVKTLYQLFSEHHIPVIRMGLHPSEDLNQEDGVLAGPYHPAFGHLVLSEVFFEQIVQTVTSRRSAKNRTREKLSETLTIKSHPCNISRIRGLKNKNIGRLKADLDLTTVNIIEDPSMDGSQVIYE
jgi:histone acetyltransferase (RNA polymerase elongator complex component)